ncbi:MAG: DUF1552 domain-containing protein [Myxococcaceae bacterium]|nr:DUF1552 domain-containing protein [Myxococcaceae bacterium]
MKRGAWHLSRRTLLQSAGVSLALPMLEAMVKPGARAAGTAPAPRRFLAVHGQVYGYVGKPDPELGNALVAPWTNPAKGYSVPLENNTYLRPFFNKKIDAKVTVLTGLTDRVLIGTHDSPVKLLANTFPVAMHRGGCVVLTRTPGPDNTVPPIADPFNGATTDQIAAFHLGKSTALPSLSLGIETIGGDGSYTMSNKSSSEPIPPDRDPQSVFNRLVAGFDPHASLAEVQRRARYRKSVLDGVRGDAARLKSKLGKSDGQKLTTYLDSVRSLERLVDEAGSIVPPSFPPAGAASTYAKGDAIQRAMQGLIVQAFVTDRTRVIAFSTQYPNNLLHLRGANQAGLDFTQYRSFNGTPLSNDHHNASHYDQGFNGEAPSAETTAFKKEWVEVYTHWQIEMYAELLAALDGYLDSDGQSTVLDNTLAIYGGDNSDSARHSYLSMPCIIGGRGGATDTGWRIKSGRQLRFADYGAGAGSERSWKDLLWGAVNIVGVPDPDGSPRLKSFGYANNPLDVQLGA